MCTLNLPLKKLKLTASQPLACEPKDPVDFDRSGFFLGDRARPVRNGDTLSILFTLRDTMSAKYIHAW